MFFRSKKHDIPAMTLEGVLGPNSRLDDADAMAVEAPDALCVNGDGQLLFSSGSSVYLLGNWGEQARLWGEFDAPVSALCAGPAGQIAIGLSAGRIEVRNGSGNPVEGWATPSGLGSVADCLFLSEDELAVVDHGYAADENILSVAPWDDRARGRVLGISRSGKTRAIATGLQCPTGIAFGPAGTLIVTELERACVIETSGKVVQSGFPAYLGRIRKTDDGYVLACWARRDPLIEFLKGEQDFVAQMKASIDPRCWISPRATPEFSHDFPIELGATRLFGEIKPWAPSFSYGLIIETDGDFMPTGSAHSRANGTRHAISDVASWKGHLVAVSKASGEILNLGGKGDFE